METLICPTCGGANRVGASICAHCSSNLVSPPDSRGTNLATPESDISPPAPSQRERPRWMTAAAVALFLMCVVIGFVGFLSGGLVVILLPLGILGAVCAVGLYGQRNWARLGLVVLLSLLVLVDLVLIVLGLESESRSWLQPLLSLPLQLYLIWWLLRNRQYFN